VGDGSFHLVLFGSKMIMLQCSSQLLPRNDPMSLPRWPASLLIKKLTRRFRCDFDVDGVLVDPADELAWREPFTELMNGAWHPDP
jgi:hypothetical protein